AQIEIKAIDLEPCLLTEAGDNLCPGGRAGYVRRHRADIAVELRVCRFGPVAECTPEIQQWIAHCCHLPIEYAHQGTVLRPDHIIQLEIVVKDPGRGTAGGLVIIQPSHDDLKIRRIRGCGHAIASAPPFHLTLDIALGTPEALQPDGRWIYRVQLREAVEHDKELLAHL